MPYIGLNPTSVPEPNTVTSATIVNGSIKTVDIADGAVTTIKMANTGAIGTYGNATLIPSFTVDSAGRITGAANIVFQTMDGLSLFNLGVI